MFAQVGGCEAVQTADGMVVYQTDKEKVHYLNSTAAIVYELCDQHQTVDSIARFMQTVYELPDAPTAEVHDCIVSLVDQGVIESCSK